MRIDRRGFLARSVLMPSALAAGVAAPGRAVSLVADSQDRIAGAPPVRWALDELYAALSAKGVPAHIRGHMEEAGPEDLCIVAADFTAPVAAQALAGVAVPSGPEALVLAQGKAGGRSVLLAGGSDQRGLVYALLELADRVRHAPDPLAALAQPRPVAEKPANAIRSITRAFVSDVEDKPWFHDRAMWPAYLSMLAAQRFNRFSFATGIGYDFPRQIRDCYLHFPYPFLVEVPGYQVRARGLADAERARNLESLQFIAAETARRGLDFQLAIWTHAWEWIDSPHANYVIEGLSPANHAAYCRDALALILQACPQIGGVTFRVHGESGVAEGSYDFWKTIFEALVKCGRRVEIDMHAKGMDSRMIDTALATGMPVNISPKYWAEHMGLPYHQASIRELEMPPRDGGTGGFFALSGGTRRFLRYGYGDLLAENRRYGVLHRIWPGTQRALLWGDPAMAAAYGRASSFCGSAGVEICEPLFFKGRKGSGLPGGRCAYAGRALNPRYDWEKFLYTYRVWGRLLYNPDSPPEVWQRLLAAQFGPAAAPAEAALSHASRILPLVTTAHGASGANNSYWPEMYVNMPVVNAAARHPYSDTPSPKRFGTVSPFDPALFSTADECAAELLGKEPDARYSPVQVAAWLEQFSATAAAQLTLAEKRMPARGPAWRRFAVDVAIQHGLGRFFAAKFRSAVLFSIYMRTGEPTAREEAVRAYRAARNAWAELSAAATGVYASDVSYGFDPHLRGHWADRLPAIDADIADMGKVSRPPEGDPAATQKAVRAATARSLSTGPDGTAARTVAAMLGGPSGVAHHTPPAYFTPGSELALELSAGGSPAVRLRYRRVNQAERWQSVAIQGSGGRFRVSIPGEYTRSPYPLQYFFELRQGEAAWIYPGLGPTLCGFPYFVVHR